MSRLLAQLTNPVVPAVDKAAQGGNSGAIGASILGQYLAVLIQTVMVLGGLAVLIFFVMGGLEWITAGGDKGRLEKARGRMVNAAIGMAVLAASIGIVGFLGPIFGLDLLRPVFINQIQ